MSIHAHAARHVASHAASHVASHAASDVASHVASHVASGDSPPMALLSVRPRRRIAFADMSETAVRETVVDLTFCDLRGRLSFSLLEFPIAIAFDGCGEPCR